MWEFLTNEAVARIVWPFYCRNSPEQAGNAIVRAAAQKWRENDTNIDDITCVTIFLEVDHQVPKMAKATYNKALINSSTEHSDLPPPPVQALTLQQGIKVSPRKQRKTKDPATKKDDVKTPISSEA